MIMPNPQVLLEDRSRTLRPVVHSSLISTIMFRICSVSIDHLLCPCNADEEEDRTQGHRLSRDERVRRLSLSSAQSTYRSCLGQEPSTTPTCKSRMNSCGSGTSSSAYIRSMPPPMPPENIEQYHKRGLILNPESDIQKAMLMAAHLLDPKSDGEIPRKISVERYQQCQEMLQRLRDISISADFAISSLQAAMHRANVPLETPEARIESKKDHLEALLTPPSSLTSEQVNPQDTESPAALEEVVESASSSGSAPPEDMKHVSNGETGLDSDFDALFDLDADIDFSAAAEQQGKTSALDTGNNDLHPHSEWKSPNVSVLQKEIPVLREDCTMIRSPITVSLQA